MSGRETIFGPCNEKLENWYRMWLFPKEMSVSPNGWSEDSRATYPNTGPNH